MRNRSYPSGAAKKKLKKIRETESLKNVPKLTSFGFKSKPKEIEGIDLSPNYVIPVRARNALWYLWSRVAMLVVLKLFCLYVS